MKPRKTRYRISVTREDIDKGTRSNSGVCAVSRAIARAIPDATDIVTDESQIRCTVPVGDGKWERWVWPTPYKVAHYVRQFDDAQPIDPFDFTLTQPQRFHSKRGRTRPGPERERQTAVNRKRRAEERAGDRPPPVSRTRRQYGHRVLMANRRDNANP